MYMNPSKPSGHYMYHQFKIQQFYVLPTQCIYVLCVDLRTNSDNFCTELTNWYLQQKYSVYRAVRTGSLRIIPYNIFRFNFNIY